MSWACLQSQYSGGRGSRSLSWRPDWLQSEFQAIQIGLCIETLSQRIKLIHQTKMVKMICQIYLTHNIIFKNCGQRGVHIYAFYQSSNDFLLGIKPRVANMLSKCFATATVLYLQPVFFFTICFNILNILQSRKQGYNSIVFFFVHCVSSYISNEDYYSIWLAKARHF